MILDVLAFFDPAVTLGIAILQNPGAAKALQLHSFVQDSIAALEEMSSVNSAAAEGLACLRCLRNIYARALPNSLRQLSSTPSDPHMPSLVPTPSSSTCEATIVHPNNMPALSGTSSHPSSLLVSRMVDQLDLVPGNHTSVWQPKNDLRLDSIPTTTTMLIDPLTLLSADPNHTIGSARWTIGIPSLDGENDLDQWLNRLLAGCNAGNG